MLFKIERREFVLRLKVAVGAPEGVGVGFVNDDNGRPNWDWGKKEV